MKIKGVMERLKRCVKFVRDKAAAVVATVGVAAASVAAAAPVGAEPLTFDGIELNVTPADALVTAKNFVDAVGGPWVALVIGVSFALLVFGFVMYVIGQMPRFSKKKAG